MNYAALVAVANKLIKENGRTFNLTRAGDIVRDTQGRETRLPDTFYSVVGIVTKYSLAEYQNSNIQGGDIKLVCTAQLEIQNGDYIDLDGSRFRVINPNPIQPANTRLVYVAQLRRD